MTKPLVRFRPHHLLCALGYEGKGYSPDFTRNMTEVVMGRLRLRGGDEVMIEVTGAADTLCAPCRAGTARDARRRQRSTPWTGPMRARCVWHRATA